MKKKIKKFRLKHINDKATMPTIKEMIKLHKQTTNLSDSYFVGMYNGMLYIQSILDGKAPKYAKCRKKTK